VIDYSDENMFLLQGWKMRVNSTMIFSSSTVVHGSGVLLCHREREGDRERERDGKEIVVGIHSLSLSLTSHVEAFTRNGQWMKAA
jgi:hypothetical protein